METDCMSMLLFFFCLSAVRKQSTEAVLLTVSQKGQECVVDTPPYSQSVNVSSCGCHPGYVKSFSLDVSGFPFQPNADTVNAYLEFTPETLVTELHLTLENTTVTFGDATVSVPGRTVDLCRHDCPMTANVTVSKKFVLDTNYYQEWLGTKLSSTVKVIGSNFTTLFCLNATVHVGVV